MANREILFRGKRADNGEWVEGDLVWLKDGDKKALYIYGKGEVIPETVGQFTGLYANGKKIFEGDILSYIDNDDEVQYISVVFEECAFLIEESGITNSDLLTSYVCLGLTVAGNIHDTPEFLEACNDAGKSD